MSKIYNREELQKIREDLKGEVVFTNGCFDLLHVGHTRYLEEAKKLGSHLIVALNTDESVKKIKGPSKPIVSQEERAEVLAALTCVDFVTFFDEDTPIKTIELLKPNILVKGGDWPIDKMPGKDIVEKNGGQVKSLSFFKGKSTTDIINKILKNH